MKIISSVAFCCLQENCRLSITDEDRERSLVDATSPRQRRSRRNLMLREGHCSLTRSIARRMDPDVFKSSMFTRWDKPLSLFSRSMLYTRSERPGLASELTKETGIAKVETQHRFYGLLRTLCEFCLYTLPWEAKCKSKEGKKKRRH